MYKRFFSGLTIAVLCLSFSLTAGAKMPGTLFAKPSVNPNYDRERSWLIYEANPGDVIEDAVVISNSLDREAIAWLYAGDSTNSSGGGFAVRQGVEERVAVGKWITLEANEIKLKAGESKSVKFKMTVPKTGVDVGEHRGGIMIEEKIDENAELPGGVSIRQRTGVRVYVTIPGEVVRQFTPSLIEKSVRKNRSEFLPFSVPRVLNFKAGVNSASNVGVIGTYHFSVKESLFGIDRKEPVELMGVTLLSNTEVDKDQRVERDTKHLTNIDWETPLFGRYTASAKFSYDVDPKNENPGDIVTIDLGKVSFWVIPWDVIIAILLLVLAAYLNRKRKGLKERKKSEVVVKESLPAVKKPAAKKAAVKKQPVKVTKKPVAKKAAVKKPAVRKKK